MTEFAIDPLIQPALIAAVAIALVAAAAWSLYRLRARAPWPARAAILLLRTVAVLALVVVLLGPSAVTREDVTMKSTVVMMADASRSMTLADRADSPTRRQQIAAGARTNQALLNRLGSQCDLLTYDFGKALTPVAGWGDQAGENLTAIGDAISAGLKRTAGRSCGGIVVFSDGRSTFGSNPLRSAAVARERGVRVHTVYVGEPDAPLFRDRSVNNLICPGVAQVNAAVTINAFVSAAGERGGSIPVTLTVDDKVVETRTVPVDQDRFSTKLAFVYTPTEAGDRRIRISVAATEGEFDTTNNVLETVMRATQKEIRILYLDGKLRWDCTFLRRTLASLPNAHFQTVNLYAESTPSPAAPTPEAIRDYNVVIIGNLKAAALGKPVLDAIEKAVRERECGLLFLAGPDNMAPDSGFAQTPLAALLPFDVAGSAPPQEKPALVRITSQGRAHFALALDSDDERNVAAWKSMPRLETLARAGESKPATVVLATADTGEPLLLTQPYGTGRVLAFMAETAWKWALASDETAERNRRFWHQAMLWLAMKDRKSRRLWLDLPRYLYQCGDPIEASVTFEDPPGSPVPDAAVQVTLQGPGGAVAQPAAFYGGQYHATLVPAEPGDCTITVEARRGSDEPVRTSARLRAFTVNTEFDEPGASPESMLAIATAGAGSCRRLAELPALIEEIERSARPVTAQRVQRRTLWDRSWLILLFAAALGVEWMVRKLNRLI